MMDWLTENGATIAVGAFVAILLGLVVYKMIKDKKNGKNGCGCGCQNCALADKCHTKK